MSFLEDNKNIGLLLIIVGIMSILAPLILFMYDISTTYVVVLVVGGIIAGMIYIFSGLSVRDGTDDKLGILPMFAGMIGLTISHDNKVGTPALMVMILGITSLINGIFSLIAGAVLGAIGSGISSAVIGIIIGIFFLIAAPIVAGNKKSSSGNVVWIILLILIILGILGALLTAFAGFFFALYGLMMLILGICLLLLFIYLLLRVLSPEIKKNMGVD